MIKVLEFCRKYRHEQRSPHNLDSIFRVENVSPGKAEKRLSTTPFNRFSLSFHQNDRTVSGHLILVTDDLENVGQGQNLQNDHFFTLEYL